MKKGKITMTITLGLVCFVFMYVMFIQFKTVRETDITQIEAKDESELRTYLASWKTKYEEAEKQLEENQAKIDEYNEKMNTNEETSELIKQELEQSNNLLGKTNVTGEGIILTIKNGTDIDGEEVKVTYRVLLELVDELKYAGAEAISINGQRIINMTDIKSPTDAFIRINAKGRVTSPYEIRAIGDQTKLDNNLNQTNGFIQKYNKTYPITFEKKKKVDIPKYNDEMKFNYATFE